MHMRVDAGTWGMDDRMLVDKRSYEIDDFKDIAFEIRR